MIIKVSIIIQVYKTIMNEEISKYKIAIISVYFGQLPNYFNLWLKTASYNNTINFLLFTDQKISNIPNNVQVIKMNLEIFSEKAQKTIGLPIILKTAYKCCDFKVAYGVIFHEYLNEFDFWGHCDLDILWGDIRKFVTTEILKQYDRIFVLGHLSLYRNNQNVNFRYMLPGSNKGDYKEIFLSEKHYAFDELEGIYRIYEKNGFLQYESHVIADISTIYKRFKCNKDYMNYSHQVFYWDKGKVYRAYLDNNGNINKEEFIYIHLQKRRFPDYDKILEEKDFIYVTKRGFFEKKTNNIDKRTIQKLNPYYGCFNEWIELKKRNLRFRIMKMMKGA